MGRPAWANEAQYLWLSDQATNYLKIKGTKARAKFFPALFDGWINQWPVPGLDDPVVQPDISSELAVGDGELTSGSNNATTTGTDNNISNGITEHASNGTSADGVTVDNKGTSTNKKPKEKPVLTVRKVCIDLLQI